MDVETKHITTKGDAPDEQGQLRAKFSTFFPYVDSDGDCVFPSAFKSGQQVPMIWGHRWETPPIGRGTVHVRRDHAEFRGRLFLDTDAGLQAYKTMRNMADLQEFSWGFRITDAEPGEVDGKQVRFIKGAECFEVSPVLVGANRQTGILSLKSTDAAIDPEDEGIDLAAVWSAAYVNNLPDSAFAVILPGGTKDSEGKTVPRSLRKLPHHDAGGSLDMAHLRNALSREPQTDMSPAAHSTASAHLKRHASGAGVGQADHDHGDDELKHPARLRARDHRAVLEALATITAYLNPPEEPEAEPAPKGLNPAATDLLTALAAYTANLARAPDAEVAAHAEGAATVARKLTAAAALARERAERALVAAGAEPADLYRAFLAMDARLAHLTTPSPRGPERRET